MKFEGDLIHSDRESCLSICSGMAGHFESSVDVEDDELTLEAVFEILCGISRAALSSM